MRAVVVEIVAPCRHQTAGMAQAVEQMLIKAFVPHPAIEAFHEPVLHRLAGCAVVPINFTVLLPFQDGIAGQFGSVVADHRAGVAPHLSNPVQLAGNSFT